MSDAPAGWLNRRIEALNEAQRQALAGMLARGRGGLGRERLVGFVTLDGGDTPAPGALRTFLSERLPDYMIPTQFVVAERMPRTPSGKLDRRALVLMQGAEPAPATPTSSPQAPRTPVELQLAAIWQDVLTLDDLGVDDDFFEVGGDSLLSIRVIARAGRAGIRISPQAFFRNPTIRHMAAAAVAGPVAGADTAKMPAHEAVGEAPLTPIQHWFLDAVPRHRDRWNQGYLVELGHPLDGSAVREVIRVLVEHHHALRLRLIERDGAWCQDFMPPGGDPPSRSVSLAAIPPEQYSDRVIEECAREQGTLRIAEGRLFRSVYLEGEARWRRILLVGHHLVLDGVSWNVILDDLATLVTQAARGEELQLAEQTAPARAWAIGLSERAAAADVAAAATHWSSMPAAAPSIGKAGTNRDAKLVTLALDLAISRLLLKEAPRRLDATVLALLLAALHLAWREWHGADGLRLDLEGHGRDTLGAGFDATRTVGWFTTVFPVYLAAEAGGPDGALPWAVVKSVQAALDALPLRGAAHGLARHLAPSQNTRSALGVEPRSELLFNYLGTHDVSLPPASRLRVCQEPLGALRHPDAERPYALELNSRVEGGLLVVTIEYPGSVHPAAAIERFATSLRGQLELVARAVPERSGLTGLDSSALDTVAALLQDLDQA